jgi:L-arabinose isomerase
LSFDVTAAQMADFAEIAGVEFMHIGADSQIPAFRRELAMNDAIWRTSLDARSAA